MRKMLFGVAALAGTGLLGAILLKRGFRFPRRLPAVPRGLTIRAVIPGIPGARYLVGGRRAGRRGRRGGAPA